MIFLNNELKRLKQLDLKNIQNIDFHDIEKTLGLLLLQPVISVLQKLKNFAQSITLSGRIQLKPIEK